MRKRRWRSREPFQRIRSLPAWCTLVGGAHRRKEAVDEHAGNGMGKIREPVTPAVRALRAAGVAFRGHSYKYVDGGGTGQVARELGIDEHLVIKTLIMEDDRAHPMVVLMHGDQQVSTQLLARGIDARWVTPCSPEVAQRHSGYQVGGTSPFGLRREMPVYAQRSIAALERLYINGGKRGFILGLPTAEALALLAAMPLELAQPHR